MHGRVSLAQGAMHRRAHCVVMERVRLNVPEEAIPRVASEVSLRPACPKSRFADEAPPLAMRRRGRLLLGDAVLREADGAGVARAKHLRRDIEVTAELAVHDAPRRAAEEGVLVWRPRRATPTHARALGGAGRRSAALSDARDGPVRSRHDPSNVLDDAVLAPSAVTQGTLRLPLARRSLGWRGLEPLGLACDTQAHLNIQCVSSPPFCFDSHPDSAPPTCSHTRLFAPNLLGCSKSCPCAGRPISTGSSWL